MIVVDTSVILYLFLPGEKTKLAESLRVRLPDWAAPRLWRSEFRNALSLYIRKSLLSLEEACAIQDDAERIMATTEQATDSRDVLALTKQSGRSAYDCEFISAARCLNTILVTEDAPLRKAFPSLALSLSQALEF